MCVHTPKIRGSVVGCIPHTLLLGDVSAEWDSRLIRWALQPMTHIAAPEHILQKNEEEILIYNRTNPNVAVFSIQMCGQVCQNVVL